LVFEWDRSEGAKYTDPYTKMCVGIFTLVLLLIAVTHLLEVKVLRSYAQSLSHAAKPRSYV